MATKRIITPTEALSKLAFACSTAEYCSYDIRTKLQRWGINSCDATKIIDRLTDEHYIDDSRYATAFCRDKYRFDGWGRIKIRYKLRSKHISDSDISDAMQSIDEDEYQQRLKAIIDAKLRTIANQEITPLQRRNKVYSHCISRGFEHKNIALELRKLNFDEPDELVQEDY